MKHRLFTLVELLTVIAVIAILAGIAVPVVVGMQSKGRETAARADMNAIKLALTQFKADYSIFPVATPSPADDTRLKAAFNKDTSGHNDAAIDAVIAELTTIKTTPGTNNAPSDMTSTDFQYNKKKRKYLDAPAKPVTPHPLVTGNAVFSKLDPWGRRYNIAMDTDYNKKLVLKPAFLSLPATDPDETIVGDVAIFSYGTAEDSEDTEAFLYSWKTNAQ